MSLHRQQRKPFTEIDENTDYYRLVISNSSGDWTNTLQTYSNLSCKLYKNCMEIQIILCDLCACFVVQSPELCQSIKVFCVDNHQFPKKYKNFHVEYRNLVQIF